MMEGERILKTIKEDKTLEEIVSDLKAYLYPLQSTNKRRKETTRTSDVSKYELFALKCLKLIIQQLPTTTHSSILFEMAEVCVTLLQNQPNVDDSKLGIFSFEKLLLHLANQAMKVIEIDTVKRCFNILKERLVTVHKDKRRKQEADSLLKGVVDILWKAAISLEGGTKHKQRSKEALTLRHSSIETLLCIPSQMLVAIERAIKTDALFIRAECNGKKSQSTLHEFHQSLLHNSHMLDALAGYLPRECQSFTLTLDWLLLASRHDNHTSQKDVKSYINLIDDFRLSHEQFCSVKEHSLHDLLVTLYKLRLELLSPTLSHFQDQLTLSVSMIPHVDLSSLPQQLSPLLESIETITTMIRNVQKSNKGVCLIQSNSFQPLKSLVLFYIQCVDTLIKVQVQTTPTDTIKVSGKSRQLSAMNILTDVLLELLMSNHDNDPKANLVTECLPLLRESCDILDSAHSLPVKEYHWIGVSAYNLGLALHQMGLPYDAVPILQIACSQLDYYCQLQNKDKTQEVRLSKKYSLLIECLLNSEQYEVVMETISKLIMSFSSDKKEISFFISQFVKAKCLMRKRGGCSNKELINKTSYDLLSGCHDNALKLLCLQEELKTYELVKQKTDDWQLTVINQLLSLSSHSTHEYAWILIKQASLLHSFNSNTDHTSFHSLSDAVKSLELLVSECSCSEESCLTFDLLGLAYLWKGICLHEAHISGSLDQCPTVEKCQDCALTLTTAIDYWSKTWLNIQQNKINQSNYKKCFLDFSSTLNHLLLCASFTHALLLPHLTLKTLNLLISLSLWCNQSDPVILCQGLVIKVQVILAVYGVKYMTSEDLSLVTKFAQKSEQKESIDGNEKEYVAYLQCKLALAAFLLQSGKVEECHTHLCHVLSHSVLTLQFTYVHHLIASSAILTSHYLQCLGKPLSNNDDFLTYISNSSSDTEYKGCGLERCPCQDLIGNYSCKSLRLTDLETALDALKLTRGLTYSLLHKDHPHQPHPEPSNTNLDEAMLVDDAEEEPRTKLLLYTPSYKTWELVSMLLGSLLRVAQLYLAHGMGKESEHFTKEGLELSKRLHLTLWYAEFLLQLAKIKDLMTDFSSTHGCVTEASQVLGMECEMMTLLQQEDNESSLIASMKHLTISTTERPFNHTHQYILSLSLLVVTSQHELSCNNTSTVLILLDHMNHLLTNGWDKVQEEIHQFVSCKTTTKSGKRRKKQSDNTLYNEIVLPYVVWSRYLKVTVLLALSKLTEAIEVGHEQLNIDQYTHLATLRVPLAALHFAMSKAVLLSLHQTHPTLGNDIWQGIGRTTHVTKKTTNDLSGHTKKKKQTRARRIASDSDDDDDRETCLKQGKTALLNQSIPKDLEPVLSHLFTACQYLSPLTLSAILIRDVYQLLGTCLSVWRSDLASHFFLLSSSVTLNLETVYWFGKKIRREQNSSSSKSIVSNMLSTLTSSSYTSYTTPLFKARSILYPLPHPLPLAYTQHLIAILPEDWIYCSVHLIERVEKEKVLVIVRVRNGRENVIIKIPISSASESPDSKTCYLIEEFNDIMTASSTSTTLTDKRQWWTRRRQLDKQLKNLLSKIQSTWLKEWRFLLQSTIPSFSSDLATLLSQYGVYNSNTWAELLVCAAQELTTQEINTVLHSLMDKRDSSTITKVMHLINDRVAQIPPSVSHPLILSLSHPLQTLPFENIPLLYNQLVTRMPSLSFLSAHILLHKAKSQTHIDPHCTYYMINPSGDLCNTEKAFATWFSRETGWSGVVGRCPTTEEFVHGLKDHDTFIYCGHGKAREYLGNEQRLQELNTRATVLQMGCSSGKLQMIGMLDPQGMALNFLVSGCPFLVANLWDVTDQDIDRFCTSLVKNWLTEPDSLQRTHDDLLYHMTQARGSCKLKYLIGASPVVYGLPVYSK